MNKSAKAVPDPKMVYSQGFSFHLSAIILSRRENSKHIDLLAYPLMTAASFACELFLKSILILEGRDHKGSHRLDKLFTSLSNKTQERIIKEWDKSSGPGDIESFNKQTGAQAPKELPELLRFCRNSYDVLRYHFDYPLGGDYGGNFHIQILPYILNNLILEMRPDWIIEGPNPPKDQAQ